MKKKILITIVLICVALVIILGFSFGSKWLFSGQYNENGISHFLVITIDESQSKEYLGMLDNHRIYIERLNIEETNFRSVDAKNISIEEAIRKNLVSLDEWKKYAWKIKKDGDIEILKYDNYEIACAYDDCIIRPISK